MSKERARRRAERERKLVLERERRRLSRARRQRLQALTRWLSPRRGWSRRRVPLTDRQRRSRHRARAVTLLFLAAQGAAWLVFGSLWTSLAILLVSALVLPVATRMAFDRR